MLWRISSPLGHLSCVGTCHFFPVVILRLGPAATEPQSAFCSRFSTDSSLSLSLLRSLWRALDVCWLWSRRWVHTSHAHTRLLLTNNDGGEDLVPFGGFAVVKIQMTHVIPKWLRQNIPTACRNISIQRSVVSPRNEKSFCSTATCGRA